ncbi:hypothetical protein [Aurantimonas sp. HBX-1]|nr:hypothetical protein [Aurantimonas sp. HBX-1]
MSRTPRTTTFYTRVKASLAGLGSSIVEARRREMEYRMRFPGAID